MPPLILAILLWINWIATDTHDRSTIHMHLNANQPQINSILADTMMSNTVWLTKGSYVGEIEVIDEIE